MIPGKRLTQFELLRLIAMLMIVTMHYLSRAGEGWLLQLAGAMDAKTVTGTILESACVIAVNVYLLISGYFMESTDFKVSRIFKLLLQIWFYALLIPLVLMIAGTPYGLWNTYQTQGIYGCLAYIFPVQTEHYWFATAYVALSMVSPFLVIAVRNMTKKQMQVALTLLFTLFCLIKSISPLGFVFDRYGYDTGWFICMYLLGAYYRRYPFKLFAVWKKSFLIYLLCVLGNVGITLVSWLVYQQTGKFAYYFTVPYHYNFILNVIGAVAFFAIFEKASWKAGRAAGFIAAAGSLSFGVYLFHEHIDLRDILYQTSLDWYGGMTQWGLGGELLHLLITVTVIFLTGLGIDFIRSRLFAGIGRRLQETRLVKRIHKWDFYFASNKEV